MSDSGTLWKRWAIGLGIAAISVGLAMVAKKLKENVLARQCWLLRKKIKSGWIRNPDLEPLKMRSEKTLFLPKHQNIQFYVKIVASEKFTKKVKAPLLHSDSSANLDPFVKENYKGLFIDNLLDAYVLLYNKFHLVPYHVLIITNDFVKQNTLLNKEDFAASLITMKALKGFVFFNSAPAAGASQEHKHLQAIPYSSYPNQEVPIDLLVEQQVRDDKEPTTYFTLPQFQFKHIFYKFSQAVTNGLSKASLGEKAKFLERVYLDCLKKLGNEDIKIAYNMVLTNHWMFLVLRKTELALNKVKINAVGFTGSFAVRSEDEYEFILTQDPFQILKLVSFPVQFNDTITHLITVYYFHP